MLIIALFYRTELSWKVGNYRLHKRDLTRREEVRRVCSVAAIRCGAEINFSYEFNFNLFCAFSQKVSRSKILFGNACIIRVIIKNLLQINYPSSYFLLRITWQNTIKFVSILK